jgi:uncharacterized SAM-binding protein YcdF (DUF218 family)
LLVACIAAAVLVKRRRLLVVAAAVIVFLYCWPPVAWLVAATLEQRYPIAPFPPGEADAIVVLSANVYPSNPSQREALPGFSTYERCSHAAWLYRHWRQLPVVVSGGTGMPGSPVISAVMKRTLMEQGVPEMVITEESHSGTTFENAVYVGDLLLPKGVRRIALVTEGNHMWRAELCFRKQGFAVLPAPCAYHTYELTSLSDVLIPKPWAITVNEQCLHEWIGLAVYRLRGQF